MGVSVKLKVGKFEVATDTPEEAAKIMTLFDPDLVRGVRESNTPRVLSSEWTPELIEAFKELLKEQPLQRATLNLLSKAGAEGKLKEDLVKDLKLSAPKQLAGPFSGLAKNANKLGLSRDAVYSLEKMQIDGKRTYRYTVNETLRAATQEAVRNKAVISTNPDLPELRDFIRSRRSALAGFMEQGASLALVDDILNVSARNDIYIRYLTDNRATIAALASDFFARPIKVEIVSNGTVIATATGTQKPNRATDPALSREALK